jgi:hypothetical protein
VHLCRVMRELRATCVLVMSTSCKSLTVDAAVYVDWSSQDIDKLNFLSPVDRDAVATEGEY